MKQAFTQFAVKMLFDDSTGFYKVNNYFATEANITIDNAYYEG